ncbi:tyrosine-type recombinase/integrase [Nonomuraea sp. NPDC049758]|uniref:tyrosine-type recombinase/integrase n=1 Tax=Nonomuraea sp. NPDC049758 TaxID=3154360 RepID=UPI0034316050
MSPFTPDTLGSLFLITIKRYNQMNTGMPLPHARLHDLRHIPATILLLAGVPVHVVAARLGHADPSSCSGSMPMWSAPQRRQPPMSSLRRSVKDEEPC